MATVTVNSIVDKAELLLQDTTNVRWTSAELVDWLNDGQREVVQHKPEASAKNIAVALTANSTKQTLPSDGVSFIRLTRNMGAGGSTPGKAIRIVSREILDAQRPDWHTDASAGYVQHYIFDPLDPKTYYVYPKAPATSLYVEMVYSAAPTNASAGGTISIDDIYANALLDYIMFRAYSKDAEYAQNAQLAIAYYTSFANSIGLSVKNALERNPNIIDGGNNPNITRRSA